MDKAALTECKQSTVRNIICSLLASYERPLWSLFNRFNHTVDRITNDDDPDTSDSDPNTHLF